MPGLTYHPRTTVRTVELDLISPQLVSMVVLFTGWRGVAIPLRPATTRYFGPSGPGAPGAPASH